MGNSDLEAQFDESPCIFPASKEIGVSETSSLLTASSSGESTNHRFLGGSAGGRWIRTISPALVKDLSAVADERRRTDKLDGVIKHRSSRETTMVGRGASLDGRLFLSGTDRRYGAGGEDVATSSLH